MVFIVSFLQNWVLLICCLLIGYLYISYVLKLVFLEVGLKYSWVAYVPVVRFLRLISLIPGFGIKFFIYGLIVLGVVLKSPLVVLIAILFLQYSILNRFGFGKLMSSIGCFIFVPMLIYIVATDREYLF